MKNFFLLVIAVSFSMPIVYAQITEGQNNMSLGVQNSLETVLDDVLAGDAVKLWTDHMKQFGSVKKNKKADEYYITGVKINQISLGSNVDVYARFVERGSSCTMIVWTDLGTAFVNSKDHPKEFAGFKAFLDEFKLKAKKHSVQKEIELADKDLKKLQKEQDGLFKDNQKLHEDIKKAEDKIAKAKEDIKTNLKDQEAKKMELDKQLEFLKSIQKKLEALGKK